MPKNVFYVIAEIPAFHISRRLFVSLHIYRSYCVDTKQHYMCNYFRFPKDLQLRIKWLEFCEHTAEDATKLGPKVVLCEKHFEEKNIIRRRHVGGTYDSLTINAVPKKTTRDTKGVASVGPKMVSREKHSEETIIIRRKYISQTSNSPTDNAITNLPTPEILYCYST